MIFKLEFALKQRDKSKKFYYYYDILIRKKDETIRLYIKKKKKNTSFQLYQSRQKFANWKLFVEYSRKLKIKYDLNTGNDTQK